MTFLHPVALFGLAAAAIPTLLHLLHRRTPPDLDFPAVRYLTAAERESARRLKLRHLLLLVLRTALVVAVVLAAARPMVPLRAGGAHEPTAFVVILDNSPSSGAVVDGRPAIEGLRRLAGASLAAATAADRVWLLLADGLARTGGREALITAVDSVMVGERRLDLVEAVGRAVRLVQGEPAPAREVHVLSDLQRTALGPGRVDVPDGVWVLALAARSPLPNRGITEARVIDGALAVAVGGTAGAGAAPLTVRWRGREVGRVLAAPGEAAALPLPPAPPGWWVGEVELEPDELRADDRRLFATRIAPPARVAAGSDVGPFVEAALAVLRDARRIDRGRDVVIGDRPSAGPTVVLPPGDAALVGPVNRALAARGIRWRLGGLGTPGIVVSDRLDMIDSGRVARRYRLEGPGSTGDAVLARVNGEPWLIRDGDVLLVGSRLDTAWTSLPATPAFVPFVDALVNREARGAAPVAEAEGASRVQFQLRGGDTVGATVFGPDPRESDLTRAATDEVERVLGASVRSEAEFAAARFAGVHRADVSALLLVLALLLAGVEVAVALLTR